VIENLRRLKRRIVARNWRCRCGKKVFDKAALGSHPLAPSVPDSNCAWHRTVQLKVLDGRIKTPEDAR
jgi:hypothetical protein